MAPVYMTVTGLNDRELPSEYCKDGVLLVEVPGLVTSSTSMGSNDIGYIAFLRRERNEHTQRTSEELNFSHYRKNILVPFVLKMRKLLYGYEETEHVDPNYTAVCWNDGCGTQLAAVVNELQQVVDGEMKIITNKHSASRTAVDQACDMAPCFCSINTLVKSHTFNTMPVHLLRDRIRTILEHLKEEGKVNLKSIQQNTLIDFYLLIHLSCKRHVQRIQ